MFEMKAVEVLPIPYKYVHERTDEVIGIESTLMNVGLVFRDTDIDLDRLAKHLINARNEDMAEIPTLLMSTDTSSMNMLNYYQGFIAISMTENDHPVIGIMIGQCIQTRVFLGGEWVEGWAEKEIQITLALIPNQPLSLEVSGADFKPEDLTSGGLLEFANTLAMELAEYSKRLPLWEDRETVTQHVFLKETLSTLAQNRINNDKIGIHGAYAPWNLICWGKGLVIDQLKSRFTATRYTV